MAAYVTLEGRLKKLNKDDLDTLRELRHMCGDFPYNQESAEKLVGQGLAYQIGDGIFLTETGNRALYIINEYPPY